MTTGHSPVSYGDELAKCFHLKEAPSCLMRPKTRFQVGLTRLALSRGLLNPTRSVIPERGFTVSVHLIQPVCRGWGTYVDGKFRPVSAWAMGGVGIYDLESDPVAVRPSAFECLHYNLPRATLEAFTEDSGLPDVGALICDQGIQDAVLFHLTLSILPCLQQPDRYSPLFLDHFVHTLCAHLIKTYGTAASVAQPEMSRGGLVLWRRRRVTELLNEHLDGNISLATLADECGLSVSHFARSFKLSFGMSFHRYLVLQRIERAKSLLIESTKALADVAVESGFCDQAAFSQRFRAVVGAPPGQWRMQNRGRKLR
jgi:AraC family transcriptional regulator